MKSLKGWTLSLSESHTMCHVYLHARTLLSSIQVRNVFSLKLYVIQSRAESDFLFLFYCLLFYCLGHINSRQQYMNCILSCGHVINKSNIKMQFISQLFTFTDITDCVYVTYECFNINLCVFDSLSSIRHERKLSLVLTCRVIAAFCACASDVCTQKLI